MRRIFRTLRELYMESYRVKSGNPFPKAMPYDLFSNKKRVQSQTMPTVVFERDMVKTGLTAVIFPTVNGANKMLDGLVLDNLIVPNSALIVEKNNSGQLKVIKPINQSESAPKCSELSFVVAFMLRGSVANDLLGGAVNTLMAHKIDLGLAQEKIDNMAKDIVAGSSVLFVEDYSNLPSVVSNQIKGKQYGFSLIDQNVQKIKIMSSTLDHYWSEE